MIKTKKAKQNPPPKKRAIWKPRAKIKTTNPWSKQQINDKITTNPPPGLDCGGDGAVTKPWLKPRKQNKQTQKKQKGHDENHGPRLKPQIRD